jgi:hypothetical protein
MTDEDDSEDAEDLPGLSPAISPLLHAHARMHKPSNTSTASASTPAGLSVAALAQLQGLHVAAVEALPDEAAEPGPGPLAGLDEDGMGILQDADGNSDIAGPASSTGDPSAARLPLPSPTARHVPDSTYLRPSHTLALAQLSDPFTAGRPTQSEVDALSLLDLSFTSLWRLPLSWMPPPPPRAAPAGWPYAPSVAIDQGASLQGSMCLPTAALLMPSLRKRTRLLETALAATARIHNDNTPVVKLELPLRTEDFADAAEAPAPATIEPDALSRGDTAGSVASGLAPTLLQAPSIPAADASIAADASGAGTPALAAMSLRTRLSEASAAGPAPSLISMASLGSPLPSPPVLQPQSSNAQLNDPQALPEPLIVQLCRRLRDARAHHLRAQSGQYALRVLLMGAAHQGAVGYPGPFRAAMSEMAVQLNAAGAADEGGVGVGLGLGDEWGDDLDEEWSDAEEDEVDVYHERLDWAALAAEDGKGQGQGPKRKGQTRLTSTHPPMLRLCANGRERVGSNRDAQELCVASVTPGKTFYNIRHFFFLLPNFFLLFFRFHFPRRAAPLVHGGRPHGHVHPHRLRTRTRPRRPRLGTVIRQRRLVASLGRPARQPGRRRGAAGAAGSRPRRGQRLGQG